MAAQKSIAKGVGAHSVAPKGRAAVPQRRAKKPRSSTASPATNARSHTVQTEVESIPRPGELLENLSARLALVETASIALQKFEEEPEIGSICAALEHAVRMLANAHEQVDLCLRGAAS